MKTELENNRAKIAADTIKFLEKGGEIKESVQLYGLEAEIHHVKTTPHITNDQRKKRLIHLEAEK